MKPPRGLFSNPRARQLHRRRRGDRGFHHVAARGAEEAYRKHLEEGRALLLNPEVENHVQICDAGGVCGRDAEQGRREVTREARLAVPRAHALSERAADPRAADEARNVAERRHEDRRGPRRRGEDGDAYEPHQHIEKLRRRALARAEREAREHADERLKREGHERDGNHNPRADRGQNSEQRNLSHRLYLHGANDKPKDNLRQLLYLLSLTINRAP